MAARALGFSSGAVVVVWGDDCLSLDLRPSQPYIGDRLGFTWMSTNRLGKQILRDMRLSLRFWDHPPCRSVSSYPSNLVMRVGESAHRASWSPGILWVRAEWAKIHTASRSNSSPWAYPVGYPLVISPRVRRGLGFWLDASSCERCRVESLIELLKQRKKAKEKKQRVRRVVSFAAPGLTQC